MKYRVIRGDSQEDIQDKVNKAISEGWIPIGGVSVHSDGYLGIDKEYYQAMIYDK